MSEEKTAQPGTGENPPVFRMQKMYVKDLSFESPNSPEVFRQKNLNPNVEVNLELKKKKIDETTWEVSLFITARLKTTDDKAVFIIELEHAGLFTLANIPAEYMEAVLAVDCPNLLFPFSRQVMSQLAVDGGFMPFLMDPVNFAGLYQNAKQKQGEKDKQQ
jgi:preprotein translocase subunit SecB